MGQLKQPMRFAMSVNCIFDESDIQELINKNSSSTFGARNAALIMGGVYWGLTPLEQCRVKVEDVLAPDGQLYSKWMLPALSSYNGEEREIHTSDHIAPFFEKYIEMRLDQGWALSNFDTHRGLSPTSYFFLNDSAKQYKPTERKGMSGGYQPRSMIEQLKRMIARTEIEGATASTYRDSFIKAMYESGSGWSDLMKVSGIKQKRTLERKVRPHKCDLKSVVTKLYSRVKLPDNLQ